MNESRLRVGVVGAGIGRGHLRGYAELADTVEIVALCDTSEPRLERVANEYNVPLRYTDAATLFQSGKIDAVSLCVPNHLHAPLSIAALEAGLHVLCEKPLAENIVTGQKIVEAAAQADGTFMIAYTRRYRSDLQWIKRAVQEGVLGEVYQIKTGWTRESGIPGWGGWFTDKSAAGGGPLIDLGIHMLDAALWVLGYPKPLTVSGATYAKFGPRHIKMFPSAVKPAMSGVGGGYTVEDAATAFIRLDGGVNLTLETSWASHARPGMDDYFATFMGTEGTLEWYVANYSHKDTLTLYTEIAGKPVITKPAVETTIPDHTGNVMEFVDCVINNNPSTATAEQGLVGLQIVNAIYESAQQGREVALG